MRESLSPALSRRSLIRLAGGGAAAAAVATATPKLFAPAIAGPAPKVRLAWTEVAACHSPMAFGAANGFYAK